MPKILWIAAVLAGSCIAAQAQSLDPYETAGFHAGDFMIRARALGVIPENTSSSISVIGGHVNVTPQAAPEVDFSYFITDNIAAELIAASTRHVLSASGMALGHVDVGSTYVLPPTVTLQWHFLPQSRFNPYVGAGLNVSFFYDTTPAGGAVTRLSMTNHVGAALQAGFDYNIVGRWYFNVDVKEIFVNTSASINGGVIHAKTALNPLIAGAGIGYRF